MQEQAVYQSERNPRSAALAPQIGMEHRDQERYSPIAFASPVSRLGLGVSDSDSAFAPEKWISSALIHMSSESFHSGSNARKPRAICAGRFSRSRLGPKPVQRQKEGLDSVRTGHRRSELLSVRVFSPRRPLQRSFTMASFHSAFCTKRRAPAIVRGGRRSFSCSFRPSYSSVSESRGWITGLRLQEWSQAGSLLLP